MVILWICVGRFHGIYDGDPLIMYGIEMQITSNHYVLRGKIIDEWAMASIATLYFWKVVSSQGI